MNYFLWTFIKRNNWGNFPQKCKQLLNNFVRQIVVENKTILVNYMKFDIISEGDI